MLRVFGQWNLGLAGDLLTAGRVGHVVETHAGARARGCGHRVLSPALQSGHARWRTDSRPRVATNGRLAYGLLKFGNGRARVDTAQTALPLNGVGLHGVGLYCVGLGLYGHGTLGVGAHRDAETNSDCYN